MFRACAAVIRAGLLCVLVFCLSILFFLLSLHDLRRATQYRNARLDHSQPDTRPRPSLASSHVNVGRVTHTTHARTRVAIDNE